MPAASPADPSPPATGEPGAAVYDLHTRRTTGTHTSTYRGRCATLSSPPPPGRTPEEGIADYAEEWLNRIHRTLADDDTAAVYTATLDLIAHTLDGAAAHGVVDADQRQQLAELMEPLKRAPHLL